MEKTGSMKPFLIGLVALALAIIAAVVAYPRYRAERDLAEKKQGIVQALAKDAAFTETLLKMELESTGVTYKELLGFCDKSIDQRNTLIVEMRVDTTIQAPKTGAAIIDFLNAENGFARAKRAFFSASLELETALQAKNDSMAGFNVALARSKRGSSRGDLEEAEGGLAESKVYLDALPHLAARAEQAAMSAASSITSFRAACEILISKEKELTSAMSAVGMPFRQVFAPYYQRSINKANEAEKKTKV